MKHVFGSLLLLAFVFAAAFYAGKRHAAARTETARVAVLEQGAFRPSPYPMMSRSFVLVVTGRNNGASVEKTLRSITSQRYDAYRVIYIDDASDDGSFDVVQEFVRESTETSRFVLAKNEQKLGVLANVFRAVQECQDGEIVVVLEDEGWLAHEWVLSRLNEYYAHSDLWLTYGQYRQYPGYELGKTRFVDGDVRGAKWEAFGLKTFYASLFKQVHQGDLIDQGKFFEEKGDLAYMVPMLEMSEGHSTFVPEVLYVSSMQIKASGRTEQVIRDKPPYRPLAHLSTQESAP